MSQFLAPAKPPHLRWTDTGWVLVSELAISPLQMGAVIKYAPAKVAEKVASMLPGPERDRKLEQLKLLKAGRVAVDLKPAYQWEKEARVIAVDH